MRASLFEMNDVTFNGEGDRCDGWVPPLRWPHRWFDHRSGRGWRFPQRAGNRFLEAIFMIGKGGFEILIGCENGPLVGVVFQIVEFLAVVSAKCPHHTVSFL